MDCAAYNGLMRTLKQCLIDCDLALLRAIAERWGAELSTNRHFDAAAELAAFMLAPDVQADIAVTLTPAEREALRVLLAAGGQMPVGAFTRQFGEIRLMGPGRLERERPWGDPLSVAESLWYNGLIYRAFDEGPGGMQEVIYMPPELRAVLQDLHAKDTIVLPVAPAPDRVEMRMACLCDDVCTLLAYAHQHALAPAPCDARWLARHQSLVTQLDEQAQDYLEFLLHLTEYMQLLKLDEHRLRPDPDHALAWLRASTFEQARAFFQAWQEDSTWNELWRVPGLRCEDTGSWHNDPLVARQTVLDFVALMQPGAWYSLDGFVAAIKTHRPDFQRPGGDYDGWYIRAAQTGDYLRGFESWDQVDGALVRYLLMGPLAWLGVIQIPDSRFRISDWGAALLGEGEASVERGDWRFEVAADGVVRVGNARRLERFQLSRVADWAQKEQDARVWVYRITPSSLERARYQRIGMERVIKFLEDNAGQAVLDSLSKALHRWGEHGTEAWSSQVVMLRLARPELLEQLMSQPATRRLIREPISSTVAAILPEHWPALRQALLEMGIFADDIAGR